MATISLGNTSTSAKMYLPKDVMIGNDTLDDFIAEKISSNMDKLATRLPTDIALGEKEFLIVKVEVGDMSVEDVRDYIKCITNMFNKQGLTKVMVYATRHGEGELQYSRLDVEDKVIE